MDAASAFAGLIGLAALTAQTALKITRAVKSIRDLPVDLSKDLQWLEQLVVLLQNIERTLSNTNAPASELELLDSFIQNATGVVRRLQERVEKKITGLDDTTGLARKWHKLKSILRSSESRKDFEELQRIISGLHLCQTGITRQVAQDRSSRLAYCVIDLL